MWVIKDVGDITLWDRTFETQEEAQNIVDGLSYFGDLLTVVEVPDINTEHNKLSPSGTA